jgi:hypothetical protein
VWALLKSLESLRDRLHSIRRALANLDDLSVRRPVLQPEAQFFDRGRVALREHFDGAVRQIACDPTDCQPAGLEPSTVAKIHTLNFPNDEKTANDGIQLEPASVRQRHGGLGVLFIRIGEGGGGVTFGLHRRQTGAREFLRL